MVEESSVNSNKPKVVPKMVYHCKYFHRYSGRIYHVSAMFQAKTTRPKAVYLWTEADVQKWLRRHCSDYYNLYWERFHEVG